MAGVARTLSISDDLDFLGQAETSQQEALANSVGYSFARATGDHFPDPDPAPPRPLPVDHPNYDPEPPEFEPPEFEPPQRE